MAENNRKIEEAQRKLVSYDNLFKNIVKSYLHIFFYFIIELLLTV